MSDDSPRVQHPERSFGLSVGAVCLAIAVALLWRGRPLRGAVAGGLGAVLLALGLIAPTLLAIPSRIWWRFALALGWINARVLLTLAYVLMMTPFGVWRRATGQDPLDRKRGKLSRWSAYPARYGDTQHYKRMY